MQVWNVLHGARCKYRTQKVVKKSPSGHHAQLCRAISLQLRHVSTIGKKLSSNISSTRSHNMVKFRPSSGWDRSGSLGHPCKFQRVSHLGSVTARHSSNGRAKLCSVEQRAPPIFDRAAITLSIGPHSSFSYYSVLKCFKMQSLQLLFSPVLNFFFTVAVILWHRRAGLFKVPWQNSQVTVKVSLSFLITWKYSYW